jgi:hypothetical protein
MSIYDADTKKSTRDTSHLISIYAGRQCVGFLLRCGREGVEAFNADGVSLGKSPTLKEAAAAVERAAAPTCARCGDGQP